MSDYNDLIDLNSLGDLMKSFMQYLSLLLCFELVMGPMQGSLFLPSQAYALDCPAGQEYNESVNRCLTKESVLKVNEATADCAGDKECYKKNAVDALKSSSASKDNAGSSKSYDADKLFNDKGEYQNGKQKGAVKAATAVAIAIPVVIVTSVLLQKRSAKNFRCKPASLMLMYAGAAALGAGEIYGYFNHKAKLKKIQEEWDKTIVPKDDSGVDKKKTEATEAQSEAFEFLAQNEDQVAKTAKTKKGFYLAATGLFAAGAIAGAVEQYQLLAAIKVLQAAAVPAGPALVAQQAAKVKAQQQIAKISCNTDKSLENVDKDGKKTGATNELEEKQNADEVEAADKARNTEDKLQTDNRKASQKEYETDRQALDDKNTALREKKTEVDANGNPKHPSAESQASFDKQITENNEKIAKLDESRNTTLTNEKAQNKKVFDQNSETISKNELKAKESKEDPREVKKIQAQNEELKKKNNQLTAQNSDIDDKSGAVQKNITNTKKLTAPTENFTPTKTKPLDIKSPKKLGDLKDPKDVTLQTDQQTSKDTKLPSGDTKADAKNDMISKYEAKDADYKAKAEAFKADPSKTNEDAMNASKSDLKKYQKDNNILDEVVVDGKKTDAVNKDGVKKDTKTNEDKNTISKTKPVETKKTVKSGGFKETAEGERLASTPPSKLTAEEKQKQYKYLEEKNEYWSGGLSDKVLKEQLTSSRETYHKNLDEINVNNNDIKASKLIIQKTTNSQEIEHQKRLIKSMEESNKILWKGHNEAGRRIQYINQKRSNKVNFLDQKHKTDSKSFASLFNRSTFEFNNSKALAIQNIAGAKNTEDLLNLMNELDNLQVEKSSQVSYLDAEMAHILRDQKIEGQVAQAISESFSMSEADAELNLIGLENYFDSNILFQDKLKSPKASVAKTIADTIIPSSHAQGGGGIIGAVGTIFPMLGGLKQILGGVKFNGGTPLKPGELNEVHEKTNSWVIKAIGKPVTRIAINGVLGGWMGLLAHHMNKQQKLSSARAVELRKMKEEFASANGIIQCREEDRLDASKPACFCFTPDNKVNPERAKQPACANTLAKMSFDPFGTGTSDKVCVDQSQNVDTACSCRAKKTCLKISSGFTMSGFKPGSFKMISAGSAPAQDLFNGNLGGGDIADSAGINAARIKAAADDMLAKIDPKGAKEQSLFASGLEKGLLVSGGGLSMGGSSGASLPTSPAGAAAALDKELKEEKEAEITTSGSSSSPTADFAPPEEQPEFGMTEDQAAEQDIEIAEVMGQELDTGNNDINSGSTTNIFDVLSNRYQRSGMRRLFNEEGKAPADAPDKSELTE